MQKLSVFALVSFVSLAFSTAANATCPTFHTLTNGSAADASQVVDNFNYILTCPNFTGSVGIGTASPNYPLEIASNVGNVKIGITNTNTTGHTWTFNSSNTGKFYLGDDTAGANRMVVDISGNVGIGTTAPNYPLELASNVGNAKIAITNTNTTGHSWTLNSSLSGNFYLGDDTAAANRVVVDTSGNVGIGTTSPTQALEVNGQIKVDSLATASGTSLCINASVIASCSSSIRYKENVRDADFGLKQIEAMRPVTFKWKGRNEDDFGLIAEDIAKINPLFVTRRDGKIEGVKYPQLTAVLVNAVKELKAVNDRQAAEIARLETRVSALQRRAGIQTALK